MSWPEKYTIFLTVFLGLWVLVYSDIYKSVMWTTNNPLFSNSSKLSKCFGKDLEMRVHLQSSLPVVCPFDFIIMKTLPSKPATGVLYENLWIVYDNISFANCDVNMTHVMPSKKLHECKAPDTLKEPSYSIDFKARTPANQILTFEAGKYYYFLATSDGTDGSLNNIKGGHCNDAQVRMKFKVYICKTGGADEKCQNVQIGEFLCPFDLPEAKTSPSLTVTPQPPIQTQSTQIPTTNAFPRPVDPTHSSTTITTATSVKNNTTNTSTSTTTTKSDTRKSLQVGSQAILDELSFWKQMAIASISALIFLIIVLIIVCYIKRHKQKTGPSFCFTDINNKVTPPATALQTPDYKVSDKSSDARHSFNNSNFKSDDPEVGKTQHEMFPIKQTQGPNDTHEKEPQEPQLGNGNVTAGVNNESKGNGMAGGQENGINTQDRQSHLNNEPGNGTVTAGVNNESSGNGMAGGQENGIKTQDRQSHTDNDNNLKDVRA